MYKHLHIRILFGATLILLLYADWKYDLPLYSYLIWFASYLLTVFWGVYFMQLNYFMVSLCKGKSHKKQIAITFDDGPIRDFTPAVLDILKAENVPAAFFLIGKNISGNEDIVMRALAEGHIIGNHSFYHDFWFSLHLRNTMTADLKLCEEEIFRVSGKRTAFFRPPYGVMNPGVAKVILRCGYYSIGWSVRTYDTGAKSTEKLLKRSLKNLENGDVILFHDWGLCTIGILSEFIREVRSRGFEIVSLDKMFGVDPYRS